ncbi:MAG: hypothetical protein P8Z75_07770, partial [Gammaproteobacteria bacterium]
MTEDALLLAQLESLNALVEATGVTEVGAQVAWNGILNQKHIVMLNVETDVTVGVFLHRMAQKTNVVYTVAMGDEPGVCKSRYDFASTLGFEVVCLGKGKNNLIDHYATPESCREEAESKGMNPKMLAAFKDGTKTMVELAAISNATGLVPDVPGTHGAQVDVHAHNGDIGGRLWNRWLRRPNFEAPCGFLIPGGVGPFFQQDMSVDAAEAEGA